MMNAILSDSLFQKSLPASQTTATRYEVELESTVPLIAQQQLNDARKAFLASPNLPATHEFRRRANDADGTLIPRQPDGTPRKPYDCNKIPKPRSRKDKESAGYFLTRHRLLSLWNGKWTNDSDWDAWDKTREKMEKQFSNYRLVEQPPPLKGWQAREYERGERKRKREKRKSEYNSLSKKTRQEKDQAEKPTPFPTPEDVLAATPLEGIRMELLLAKFYQPRDWDTERFCSMLHLIGNVNKFTKMFVPGKRLDRLKALRDLEKAGGNLVDAPRFKIAPENACIKFSRVEAC